MDVNNVDSTLFDNNDNDEHAGDGDDLDGSLGQYLKLIPLSGRRRLVRAKELPRSSLEPDGFTCRGRHLLASRGQQPSAVMLIVLLLFSSLALVARSEHSTNPTFREISQSGPPVNLINFLELALLSRRRGFRSFLLLRFRRRRLQTSILIIL